MTVAPKAPARLAAAGRKLWRDLWRGLDDLDEFDERELAILEAACRQADDVAALEAALARDGVIVTGSQGQPRLNAVVTELRQGRLAFAKLLGELGLRVVDAPEAKPAQTMRSARASHAARSRWEQVETRKARRHGSSA